jgi:exodeoxyribonuclease VII large subunit
VVGEISNLSRPASGHVYFTLKDSSAALKCVMWKTNAARLNFPLRDGMEVEVHGKIGVYEVNGQYQLYADQIRSVGEGALYQEFMRLKAMLEAEGLFAPERKRPILNSRKRLESSHPTGAALRDMLNTLRRRLPLVQVILVPSPVQGTEAPPALVKAIQSLNLQSPDVIIIARGGGSIEDLWAFNDERVVRAVAGSQVPVICGVGHETDFTLCDFAADLRAPTPTAAAELATQITILDLGAVQNYRTRLASSTLLCSPNKGFSCIPDRPASIRFPPSWIERQRGRSGALAFFAHHRISCNPHVKGMQRRRSISPLAVLSAAMPW